MFSKLKFFQYKCNWSMSRMSASALFYLDTRKTSQVQKYFDNIAYNCLLHIIIYNSDMHVGSLSCWEPCLCVCSHARVKGFRRVKIRGKNGAHQSAKARQPCEYTPYHWHDYFEEFLLQNKWERIFLKTKNTLLFFVGPH